MKARLLVLFVVLIMGLVIVGGRAAVEAREVSGGTAVSEEEAIVALAYGRLIPGDSESKKETAVGEGLFQPPTGLMSPSTLEGTVTYASTRQGPYNIFSQAATGGPAQTVVSSSGNDATPVWSPDGTRLLFASNRDGDFDVYLREANGIEKKLTFNTADDFHPTWSPDGTRVLFTSNRSGGYFQAYTMNTDGSNVQQIGVIANNVLYPRFSPDGSRIAFMRASIALPACDWNWDIWIMNADGNNQLRVTTQLGGDLYPNWTPDGKIIYASCRNFFTSDIYIVDPSNGSEGQVTNWSGSEMHGIYSPDGAHLVFNANGSGNDEIYVGTWADGSSFNLSNNGASDLTPNWYDSRLYAVSGQVTDTANNPIAAATITTELGQQATTNANGEYFINGLSAGTHTLRATKGGYAFLPTYITISGPPDISNQNFVGRDCSMATASQPLLLVTGWGGSEDKINIIEDKQLRYFIDFIEPGANHEGHLPPHGYVEGCNLFYATDTSPYRFLYTDILSPDGVSNSTIIRDDLCDSYPIVEQVIPNWSGTFDIIAHSYGGLRARAYLESDDLYGRDLQTGQVGTICPGTLAHIQINNLYTMGTPHGGEWPTLPFSIIIGLEAVWGDEIGFDPEIPALLEMMPPIRELQNWIHSQPPGVTYHFIAGDARDQVATKLTPLKLIYEIWKPAQENANDFAVHTSNANALLPFIDQYPNVSRIITQDIHGQVPPELDPLELLRSYVNPRSTFEEIMCPHIFNPSLCQTNDAMLSNSTDILIDTSAPFSDESTNLNQVQQTPVTPLVDIKAGSLSGDEVITGQFAMNGTDSSAVVLAWADGNVALSLADPNGKVIDSQSAGSDSNIDYLLFTGGIGLTASYQMTTTVSGGWTYTITANSLTEPTGYRLVVIPPTPIAVTGSTHLWVPNNNPAVITATVSYEGNTSVIGGNVTVGIRRPDDTLESITMLDDGNNHDGAANDGVFGTTYTQTALGGLYSLGFTATGIYESEAYERTAVYYFTVAPATASLSGQYSDRGISNNSLGLYEQLEVIAELNVTNEGTYALSADLFSGNTFITQAMTQVHLTPGTRMVTLGFDGVNIRAAQLDGPFTLRNVILLDETEVSILIEEDGFAYTTSAYQYQQFGIPAKVFLPTIIRD